MSTATQTAKESGLPAWSRSPLSTSGNIPRFVSSDSYAENFGCQWNRFPKTQLDSYIGMPLTEERLRRILGADLFSSLPEKCVLEAGCGAGRFTEILLNNGARVMSVDLSAAVEANAANFPVGPSHRVAQADIMDLPFERSQFDLVICLGVLQHTESPERSIQSLFDQVKPGGWLVIDHYGRETSQWTSLKPLYRAWLKRQSSEKRWEWTNRMVNLFLPTHRRLRSSRLGWTFLSRVSPLITYYRAMPDLHDSLQREFSILDTHDSLTDWHKHIRSKEQIARALAAAGAAHIECWNAGNGIEARCAKPDQSASLRTPVVASV